MNLKKIYLSLGSAALFSISAFATANATPTSHTYMATLPHNAGTTTLTITPTPWNKISPYHVTKFSIHTAQCDFTSTPDASIGNISVSFKLFKWRLKFRNFGRISGKTVQPNTPYGHSHISWTPLVTTQCGKIPAVTNLLLIQVK